MGWPMYEEDKYRKAAEEYARSVKRDGDLEIMLAYASGLREGLKIVADIHKEVEKAIKAKDEKRKAPKLIY